MKIFKTSLLLLSSAIFTILLIEIFLSNFFPQPRSDSWRVQNERGVYYNANNITARHEYLGKNEKLSVKYKFGKYHNRIYSDFEISNNKNNILVLGDSIIFGWLLKDEDTFIYKLQKDFIDLNFINAAAGGFSDSDSSIYIEEYCKILKPKKILFFLEIDRIFYNTLYSLDEDNNLVKGKVKINKFKKKLNSSRFYYYINKTHSFQIIKKVYFQLSSQTFINHPVKGKKNITKNSKNEISKKKILSKQIYNKIVNDVIKCNSEIIFIYLGWKSNEMLSNIKKSILEEIPAIVNSSNNSYFISLDEEFENIRLKKKTYFLEEGHPNKNANEIVYKKLKSRLNDFTYFN